MKNLLVVAQAAFAAAALCVAGLAFAEAERSGEQIVNMQCVKCHGTGQFGAPRMDDRAAWAPRMRNGLDATVRSAIRGHGAMPARGGVADLTDTELRAAILYMFYPAGATFKAAPPESTVASAPNVRRVDDTDVFLGLTPAASIRASGSEAERKMHGGVPGGDDVYHVNISLRDARSGGPISDAQVEVSVSDPVMGGETKKLNPVTLQGATSFGNYFRLTGREPHTLTVHVRRAHSARTLEAKFEFKG